MHPLFQRPVRPFLLLTLFAVLCSVGACSRKPEVVAPLQPETPEIIKARRARLGWENVVGSSPREDWNSGEWLRRALGRPVGDTVLVAWCIDRSLGELEHQSAIIGEFTDSGVTLYSIGRRVKFGIVQSDWRLNFIKGPPNFLSEAACPLPLNRQQFDWFIDRCEWRGHAGSDPDDECGELAE
ncbi:MAG: hypothetical protein JNM94_14565 [Phycisphaerae bacterium]|nr:hypothetical protein [Phycisphaerae bacterium]